MLVFHSIRVLFPSQVEGGRIDQGLHITESAKALEEVLAFDDAVNTALSMLDLSETLVIITADHSHVMTINGYAARGNNILGTATAIIHNRQKNSIYHGNKVSQLHKTEYIGEKYEKVQ